MVFVKRLLKNLWRVLDNEFDRNSYLSYGVFYVRYGNSEIVKRMTKIEKLEDKLAKCGVKWDFRLDELHGFITDIHKKIADVKSDISKVIELINGVYNKLSMEIDYR